MCEREWIINQHASILAREDAMWDAILACDWDTVDRLRLLDLINQFTCP